MCFSIFGSILIGRSRKTKEAFSISSGNVIISGDIAHDADSDTTFGFGAGNDTFTVKTAGTERISVSGGYVGINVTNPQAFLDIGGNADGDVGKGGGEGGLGNGAS